MPCLDAGGLVRRPILQVRRPSRLDGLESRAGEGQKNRNRRHRASTFAGTRARNRERCNRAILSECQAGNLSEATISKYRVLLEKQLTPFAEKKALRFVDEFTIELLREFRHSWKDAPLAASKKGERLRAFFRFSHDSGYIKLNPATHLRPPKVKPNEKQPFENDEIEASCRFGLWTLLLRGLIYDLQVPGRR
jgi:hypothetical protein